MLVGPLALLSLLSSCSSAVPPARPNSSQSSPATTGLPSASATSSALDPVAIFDAERVYRTMNRLAVTPREDSDASFRSAADLTASAFKSLGYTVTRQQVPVPAGMSVGTPVKAGTTQNIVAVPPGYSPKAPHLIVGAHLDTVSGAPGANDNASGVAIMLECARLARMEPTGMPIVWVAFGGEERRRKGPVGALFGSRAFVKGMQSAERDTLRGMISLDVLGAGSTLQISSGGVTPHVLLDAFTRTATRLGVPAKRTVVTRFFSDHKPFEENGFPVAWLWTGEFPQVHTPRDTIGTIDRAALDRTGRVAWETIRTVRL